jgi:HK97 family phage prohead protease
MPTSGKQKQSPRELFFWRNHRAEDAELHQSILDQGDHQAAEGVGRSVGKRLGLSDADLDALLLGGGTSKKSAADSRAAREYEEDKHPRDESGKWTDGGGGGGGGGSTGGDKPSDGGKREHPGPGYSASAYVKDGVIHTSNVYDAQRALFEDRKVELAQVKQVSTLIKRLGETAAEMAAQGETAPVFNLCNVSVPGTNLFCADTKGIPRVEMPVIPAKQTKEFIKYLKGQGYEVEKGHERAANLRATQSEISGAKVATQMARIKKDGFYKRLVISKDDYILDGHHTWAGQLGIDAQDNNLHDDKNVKIARVNISITKLIAAAEKFTGGKGKKPASESKSAAQVLGEFIRAMELAMPISPHKDETQQAFMGRCVPEMVGTGADKRPQDQAVAACLTIWRDKDKAKTVKQAEDVDPPDDDETYDDFMDRCTDELTDDGDMDPDAAAEQCQMVWDERHAEPATRKSAPPSGRVFKTHVEPVNGMEFILSDESVDRMGDVISATGWDIANFTKNPIALFNHRTDFPIGKWRNLRVEKNTLRGHLVLAPEGTSPRIDEIRRLIEAGILRAVSVGFRPSDYEPLNDSEGKAVGFRFTKQELLETSLVAVPANPNALQVAKSLKISPATLDLVFAGQGRKDAMTRRRGSTGGQARRISINGKGTTMSLAQRVKDSETRLLALKDELRQHFDKVDDTNVTDDDLKRSDELNEKIDAEARTYTVLVESERHLGATSDDSRGGRTTALAVTNGRGSGHGTDTGIGNGVRPFSIAAKKIDPIEYLVRAGTVQLFAHLQRKPLDEIRQAIYGEDEPTRAVLDWATRAATAPAMTTVTGWAAELVQQIVVDFMALLLPKSIFPRLSAMGLSLTFGRNGKIIIPTRSITPTIAGSFVGEGAPIPVRQGAFTSQTLTPKKMAVITTWTREISEHSIPAIEGLLRNAIQEDTAVSLDAVLLDANAATVIRPAGILNGVTALTATTGGGFAALVGDIKQLSGALLTGTRGNVRNPAWLMNPQQVNSAGLVAAPGVGAFPFRDEISRGQLGGWPIIDSGTVPLGTVVAIDAADFVAVGGEAPRFEISDQATLHLEDTSPADIVGGVSPGTPAFPTKSMWQTDSLALRLIMPINWVIRRPGTVAWTQSVTW